jgi:hypothetical protein
MSRVVKYIGVWVMAAVVSFVAFEIGYRVRLAVQNPFLWPTSEAEASAAPINAFTRSFWHFNAAEGYDFASREDLYSVAFQNGKILGCGLVPQLNKYGGPGPTEGSYEDAQVKIAMFGNSFSLNTNEDNLTWLHYLQRELAERLHRSVHVMNFARDGMSLLQMFDVAASKLPEYKPDLAIIAFVTDRGPRHWRTETMIDGEPRVLSMLSPIPAPTVVPPGSYDTFLVDHRITAAWCDAHKKDSPYDQVARDVISRYERVRDPTNPHYYQKIFTLYYSFLWNRLVYKNPFHNFFLSDPQLTAKDYADDKHLAASINAIKQTGIPYLVVHLPLLPEVKAEKEYSDPAVGEIVQEVGHLTGQPVYGLLDYMPLPMEHPERMTVTNTDLHPSKFGMLLYANAATNLVLKVGTPRTAPLTH